VDIGIERRLHRLQIIFRYNFGTFDEISYENISWVLDEVLQLILLFKPIVTPITCDCKALEEKLLKAEKNKRTILTKIDLEGERLVVLSEVKRLGANNPFNGKTYSIYINF
jgi:hypothetical protein